MAPAAIAAVAAVAAVAGTVTSTVSQVQASKSAANAAEANAEMARREGESARLLSEQQAKQVERQGERLAASQFAAAGASGVVPTTGSSYEVMLDTAREAELRRLDELYQGTIRKDQSDYAASIYKSKARSARSQGNMAIAKGAFDTIGVLGKAYAGMGLGGSSGP